MESASSSTFALEGNIGVGKTTFCRKLKAYLKAYDAIVHEEMPNERLLALFYSDTKKYAFALQLCMLAQRLYQRDLSQRTVAMSREDSTTIVVHDRTEMGDYIFALWNYLSGNLTDNEMDVYEDMLGGTINDFAHLLSPSYVTCYVLLESEPSACKQRVEQLRGNVSESNIPLDYYEGLDDIHFNLFVRLIACEQLAPVRVFAWGQYHRAEHVWERLTTATNFTLRTVRRVHSLPDNMDPFGVYIYRNADAIRETYRRLTLASEDYPWSSAAMVFYIPENVMDQRIPPFNMAEQRRQARYPRTIKFYENAYKRVVYYHLSERQRVVFYPLPTAKNGDEHTQ